jgi:hypothetical protein
MPRHASELSAASRLLRLVIATMGFEPPFTRVHTGSARPKASPPRLDRDRSGFVSDGAGTMSRRPYWARIITVPSLTMPIPAGSYSASASRADGFEIAVLDDPARCPRKWA